MNKYATQHGYFRFNRNLIRPGHPSQDALLTALQGFAVASGAQVKAVNGLVETRIHHKDMDGATLAVLLSKPITIENLFAAVELTNVQTTDPIPEGVRGPIRLDEQGDVRTWQEYVDALPSMNMTYVEALDGSKRIVYLNTGAAPWYSNEAELAACLSAGLTVLMQTEVDALLVPGGDYTAASQP